MENILVTIPQERITTKSVKGKDGDFDIAGIQLGDKFVRLVVPQGFILPVAGNVEGNLYGRKYETKFGHFTEVAIYVTNGSALPPTETK
jgi:hypothetical protein